MPSKLYPCLSAAFGRSFLCGFLFCESFFLSFGFCLSGLLSEVVSEDSFLELLLSFFWSSLTSFFVSVKRSPCFDSEVVVPFFISD